MKKSNVLFLLAAGALMFTACGNDEPYTGGEGDGSATHEIVLQVANGGDGLTTRAGRPLYSSEAKQSIENVKVIITDGTDNVIYTHEIANWNTAAANYGDASNGHGKTMRITIPTEVKFNSGAYTVYAVGYHNASDYNDITTKIAQVKAGDTFEPNTLITTKTDAEEIFAGSYTITAVAGEGFRANVILNRQVAGVFTYLSHIPYYDGAKYLQLYASTKNTQLVLGNFANTELKGNGTENTSTNVINGTTADRETLIYSINLLDWFKEIKDADNDNLIDLFDGMSAQAGNYNNWQNPRRQSETQADATFVKGSVFGGCFIIPFKATTANTFELKMTDDQNNELQTWVIKLGDAPLKGNGTVWNGTKFDDQVKFDDNANVYSVFRNHLYGVGRKIADGNTDPENPEPKPDPDPKPNPEPTDPDVPTPINKKHELVLKVNDNWEVIHNMEIE